jgi:GDP-mannose pyrophosphatase NudK
MESTLPLMILIAGPYRSGTGDDPVKIEANVRRMEEAALEVYRKGHLPVLGEWLALPLLRLAGSTGIGDEVFTEFFHPAALRLLEKCDAVLRIGGISHGADEMIRTGQEYGKFIFLHTEDIPEVTALSFC